MLLIPTDKLTAFCRIIWMDDKTVPLYDTMFSQVRWKEDSVTTVDLAISYKLSTNAAIWARAENLFDEDYTEGGYIMPGRWMYAGIRLDF